MNSHSIDEGLLQRLAQGMVSLTRNPDAAVYSSLADILLQLDRPEEALEMTTAGSERFPEDAGLALLEAELLMQRKDYSGAFAAVDKALKVYPDNPQGLWLAARLHRQLGEKQQAIESARRLLQIKPDHAEVKSLLTALGVAPESVGSDYRGDEDDRRKQTITTATLAEIYVKQGYLNKAVQVYREILSVDPGNEQALARLHKLERQLAAPAAEEAREQVPPAPPAPAAAPAATAPPMPRPEALPVAPQSREERLLAVFQGWLDAIRQRRSHVH